MERIDRRVKRTNRLLQEALIGLTLERGYDTVTIRDITEQADVGYATFFRHYPDKDALLADVLQSMKEDFESLLAPHWLVSEPEKGCTVLFQYVQENIELCKVLLSSTSTMELLKPAQEMGVKGVKDDLALDEDSPIPVEMAANHLISSLILMVRWWIEQGLPYSAEEMGHFTAKLVVHPVMEIMSKR